MATRAKRLRKARRVRSHISGAFHRLESGALTLEEILLESAGPLDRVDIWDVLRRTPKLGRERSKKVLLEADVWPHTRICKLTPTERHRILEVLGERAGRSDS